MIAQMTAKNGIRMSSARAFLRPVQDRPNLHIMLNTTATKVLVHPKSKNAQGVEVVDAFGHTMKILAKKEVIISGGAVNSPQILMLSGIGPKEELVRVRKNCVISIDFCERSNIINSLLLFLFIPTGGNTTNCGFARGWKKLTQSCGILYKFHYQ